MSKNKSQFTTKMLVDMSIEKLLEKCCMLKKEFFNLRIQKTAGDLKNTSRFAKIRKDIARINTELNQRKFEVRKNA